MSQQLMEGYRLSPQQKRLWEQSRLSSGFDTQGALLLDGCLNVPVLVHSLQLIVDRHEILRTCFSRLPGIKFPVQAINEPAPIPWHFCDYSYWDPQQQLTKVELLAAHEVRLREEQQQPVRFAVCALSAREHLLVM